MKIRAYLKRVLIIKYLPRTYIFTKYLNEEEIALLLKTIDDEKHYF
jgi:hypothetical protein